MICNCLYRRDLIALSKCIIAIAFSLPLYLVKHDKKGKICSLLAVALSTLVHLPRTKYTLHLKSQEFTVLCLNVIYTTYSILCSVSNLVNLNFLTVLCHVINLLYIACKCFRLLWNALERFLEKARSLFYTLFNIGIFFLFVKYFMTTFCTLMKYSSTITILWSTYLWKLLIETNTLLINIIHSFFLYYYIITATIVTN